MPTTLSNTPLFLLKKCENLLQCKRFSHFFNKKNQRICDIYFQNFKETLTNDVVNFEQQGPGPDVIRHFSCSTVVGILTFISRLNDLC